LSDIDGFADFFRFPRISAINVLYGQAILSAFSRVARGNFGDLTGTALAGAGFATIFFFGGTGPFHRRKQLECLKREAVRLYLKWSKVAWFKKLAPGSRASAAEDTLFPKSFTL
jgi:hypothetical protein